MRGLQDDCIDWFYHDYADCGFAAEGENVADCGTCSDSHGGGAGSGLQSEGCGRFYQGGDRDYHQ